MNPTLSCQTQTLNLRFISKKLNLTSGNLIEYILRLIFSTHSLNFPADVLPGSNRSVAQID